MPIIFSGGEDDVINVWSSSSFKIVTQLPYGLKRVWSIAAVPEMNAVAFGMDEGTIVIKIGKDSYEINDNYESIAGKVLQVCNYYNMKNEIEAKEV